MGIFQSKSNTSPAPAPAPAAAAPAPAAAPASTTAAASSASAASTSAKAASDSASAAATSATAAATSVSAASTSATNAATSASAASTSATNAASSATAARNYATNITTKVSMVIAKMQLKNIFVSGVPSVTNDIIQNIVGENDISHDSTQAIGQKRDYLRIISSNKVQEFIDYLNTYLSSNSSLSRNELFYGGISAGRIWLDTNIMIDIPSDKTSLILGVYQEFLTYLTALGNINNYILGLSEYDIYRLKALIISYINSHNGIIDNLRNIIEQITVGTRNLSQWQTISESFTNYSSNRSINNIDYSKISINNGSSMWHSRLSGSPFSPKV